MKESKQDLSKPFVHTYEDEDNIIIELNSPNDQIGDFAFEWDLDGSARKRWEEYLEELDRKGIRGQLQLKKIVMRRNPAFDGPYPPTETKLEDYKFIIEDYGKE